jgi:hypothetical protein
MPSVICDERRDATTMPRRLQSAALLAAVSFAAAGCGGTSPTPPPLNTASATSTAVADGSPTPSPTAATPSPSRSASPAADDDGSDVGTVSDRAAAGKVLSGFLAGLDAAAKAKSSDALKPLYTASCLWCAEQTKSIDLAAFLGGTRTGGVVSGTSVKYRGVGKQKQLVFDVTMSVSAMKVVDRDGRKQLSAPAVSHGAFTFGVGKSGGAWIVVDGSQGRKSL